MTTDRDLSIGFHAGELGASTTRFHSASLAIVYDRLTIAQLDNLEGDWATLFLQEADFDAIRRLSGDVREFLATLAHEHDHMRRLLSTSFGFMLHLAETAICSFGLSAFVETLGRGANVADEGPRLAREMARLLERAQLTAGPAELYLKSLSPPESNLFWCGSMSILQRALMGSVPPRDVPPAQFALRMLDWLIRGTGSGGDARFDHRIPPEVLSDRSSSPVFLVDPPLPITATHILECQAILTHASVSASLGLANAEFLRLL